MFQHITLFIFFAVACWAQSMEQPGSASIEVSSSYFFDDEDTLEAEIVPYFTKFPEHITNFCPRANDCLVMTHQNVYFWPMRKNYKREIPYISLSVDISQATVKKDAGDRVGLATPNGTFFLFNPASQLATTQTFNTDFSDFSFRPNRNHLVVLTNHAAQSHLAAYDIETAQRVQHIPATLKLTSPLHADENYWITSGSNTEQYMCLYDARSGKEYLQKTGIETPLAHLLPHSQNSSYFIINFKNSAALYVWDIRKVAHRVPNPFALITCCDKASGFTVLKNTPDNKRIIGALSNSPYVAIWDSRELTKKNTFYQLEDTVQKAEFLKDGTLITKESRPDTLTVYLLHTGWFASDSDNDSGSE